MGWVDVVEVVIVCVEVVNLVLNVLVYVVFDVV